MKEALSIRFLYNTLPGRLLLKLLTAPGLSRAAGRLLSSPVSRLIVPYYIKKNHIDMTDIIVPEGGFSSFNDFFTRERKAEQDTVPENGLISPCDGLLSVRPIGESSVFEIKHTAYRLEELLRNRALADRFIGGTALIFRLTPNHYHRYCFPAKGRISGKKHIPGILHCVRPLALEKYPVFSENSREYNIIRTKSFGIVVQMEIGAMMVGKINNAPVSPGMRVVPGQEKGYFEFGGSTIVLLLQKGVGNFRSSEEHEIRRGNLLI